MDTNALFLSYAKKYFDVDLPPSDVWTDIGFMAVNARALQDFVERFYQTYASNLKKMPALEELARPLFFAIAMHGARQPANAPWWTERIAEIVPLWTRNGTRDMACEEAAALADLLRHRLSYGENACIKIACMLWASPALWEQLGDGLLEHVGLDAQSMRTETKRIGFLVHRYYPERVVYTASDARHAYGALCGRSQDVKPALLDMARVLVPLHHNTQAWTAAFMHSEHPAPGQWMALTPVLASLPINPDDVFSWELLARLNSNSHDASCAELVDSLLRVHTGMAQAWSDLWPAVNAMYERDARCGAAVALWRNKPLNIENWELPALSA